jgi:excisionase family DNA binding protein
VTAALRIVTVTVEELEKLVEAAVRRALAEVAAAPAPVAADWLDASGAAELLAVNPRTIMKLVKAGKLRGGRVGKLWRFRRVDVEGLLETRDRSSIGGA